ncbi:MAG: hypothetical protein AAB647_01780 [Patescibacteria group bacterium]
MGRRTELSLAGLIVLAAVATSILVWGQQTGKFKIFGDAFMATNPVSPLALESQAVVQTTFSESFDSLRYFDAMTTADWNIDAGEVTLPYGASDGVVRSLAVAGMRGENVWVSLKADEDRPEGSTIYYAVSADDGVTWQSISNLRLAIFTNPAGTWRWRAYLARGVASRPPALKALELTFYTKNS